MAQLPTDDIPRNTRRERSQRPTTGPEIEGLYSFGTGRDANPATRTARVSRPPATADAVADARTILTNPFPTRGPAHSAAPWLITAACAILGIGLLVLFVGNSHPTPSDIRHQVGSLAHTDPMIPQPNTSAPLHRTPSSPEPRIALNLHTGPSRIESDASQSIPSHDSISLPHPETPSTSSRLVTPTPLPPLALVIRRSMSNHRYTFDLLPPPGYRGVVHRMSAEIGNISERRINAEATRRGIPSAQRTNAKLILSVDLADFRVSKSQFLPEFNATVIYSVARYDDSGHAVGSFIVSGHSSSVNERTTGYHDGALSPDYFFRKAVESAVEDGMRRLFDRIESAGR